MKRIIINFALFIVFLSSVLMSGCTNDFENLNTNPRTIGTLEPEQLFYRVQTEWLKSGHAWNGIFIAKMQWMQYGTPAAYFTGEADMRVRWNFNSFNMGSSAVYSEYNNMGSYLMTIENIIEKSANPDYYSDLVQMGRILLIAKAIQTSDMWGSLAYSDAWLARKGLVDDESMEPSFQLQEELVDVWDTELKQCIQHLQSGLNTTRKVSLRGIDRAYNGNTQQWIKAANAIRLRLASRIWKKQPSKAEGIASEVLSPANSANIFDSKDDNFIFWFDNLYTTITNQDGDWHSVRDLNRASATFMDYLNKYQDPRKPVYFQINNLTAANIAEFNRQRKVNRDNPYALIPPDFSQWMGAVMSFDRRASLPSAPSDMPKREDFPNDQAFNTATDAFYDNWDFESRWASVTTYDRRYAAINAFSLPGTTANIDMRPANIPDARLWRGNLDAGTGGNWAPVMTYADFAFLAAEFVLRANIPSSKTAQQWYEAGLRASVDTWLKLGEYCRVYNYTLSWYANMTNEAAITRFLTQPDIQWNPAKGLEQIYAQTYVEHYKNIDEMWAFWKRTGYPDKQSGIITFEPVMVSGVEREIPRRVRFTYPNEGVHNYLNLKKRIDDMTKDPIFGGVDNEFGRLWWDVQ